MNKETIEEAAEAYVMGNSASYVECFKAGAEWRINSVWHDARKEEPADWKLIIREDIMGDHDLGCELAHDTVRWAYMEDLIPDNKR